MSLEVLNLRESHLEAAAALVTRRYAALRETVPCMPSRYGDIDIILPMILDIPGREQGVAAIDDGILVGFLLGLDIGTWRGVRSVMSPEYANGAELENSRRIYAEMYAYQSARWVAEGFGMHIACMLANDADGIESWNWLGFGLAAVDGARDLESIARDLDPVSEPTTGIEIRRATSNDVQQILALEESLKRHLAAAPTFLSHGSVDTRAGYEKWLADPANALWLAEPANAPPLPGIGQESVAFMKQGPASEDACTIILDEATTSIVGAYTVETMREAGIATKLLDRCLDFGRSQGYSRCTVDLEPMNVPAARFWMRYFQPVCISLARYVGAPLGS